MGSSHCCFFSCIIIASFLLSFAHIKVFFLEKVSKSHYLFKTDVYMVDIVVYKMILFVYFTKVS